MHGSNTYRHSYEAIFSNRGHPGAKSAISAFAAPKPTTATLPAFPGTLANAQYVYVAAYDGDQFDTNLLPEDREAISSIQNAIQSWGKLTLVYQPSQADIIILSDNPTFRRCHGCVRRAPRDERQLSLARHGPRRSRLGRNSTRYPI